MPSTKRRRRLAIAAVLLVVLFLTLYLARTSILVAMGSYLRVEDPWKTSDVIFVLAGESYVRPGMAAELHRLGYAERIVIPVPEWLEADRPDLYPNPTLLAAWQMQRLGVPREHIVMLVTPGGTTSTIDDARLFRDYADRHGVRRALVVTSEYHTRRTRWVMRRTFKGSDIELIMVPALEQHFNAHNWWKSEDGLLAYIEEYLKWLHNATQW